MSGRLSLLMAGLMFVGGSPSVAMAQATETFELSDALFYECSVTEDGGQGHPNVIKIAYFAYPDKPDDPTLNFFDPAKIILPDARSPGGFTLPQRVVDGPLFVWVGRRLGSREVHFSSSIEVTAPDAAGSAKIVISSFARDENGAIRLRRFAGACEGTSGAEAYYKYSGIRD